MSRDFKELIKVVETLRGTDGCPWDKEQTHLSLKPLLIEEVYELVSAIEENNQADWIEKCLAIKPEIKRPAHAPIFWPIESKELIVNASGL